MSTTPYVRHHLVREIMHMIRLLSNGDTLMHLTLAGKGHLGILQYVAETHFVGVVTLCGVHVTVNHDKRRFTSVRNTALRCLVLRYLKTLTVYHDLDPEVMPLSFVPENITKLVWEETFDILLLNSLPNIETLVVKSYEIFFHCVKFGALNLKNLQHLTLKLGRWMNSFDEVLEMLPLRQDNIFELVKHLKVEVELPIIAPVNRLLAHLYRILHCFPSIDTSMLLIDYYDNEQPPLAITQDPDMFIEWLEKLEIPGSFTMTYHEKYRGRNITNLAAFKEEVKSVGFAETDDENTFAMVKTFFSVKFIYYAELVF